MRLGQIAGNSDVQRCSRRDVAAARPAASACRPSQLHVSRQRVACRQAIPNLGDEPIVEVEDPTQAPDPACSNQDPKPRMSSVQTYGASDSRVFQVLLAVITQLWGSPQLEAFLASRAEATSMPFLMWLADREAAAEGADKARLAALCERLVMRRERQDNERMEVLYSSTMGMLADDAADAAEARDVARRELGSPTEAAAAAADAADSSAPPGGVAKATGRGSGDAALQRQQRRDQALALLSSSPELYAAALAEKVTGQPALVEGFDPMYDLILQAAPPAALTVEGVRKAHGEARELAADMKQRRKRSVAAIIGRAQLTPEQADRLKAGSAALRILDMLLTLPTHEQRIECLPDCFTPPEAEAAEPGDSGGLAPQQAPGGEEQQGMDELWCTPSQLLSEVESRVRSLAGGAAPQDGRGPVGMLPGGGPQLTGPELLGVLQQLREGIRQSWLQAML